MDETSQMMQAHLQPRTPLSSLLFDFLLFSSSFNNILDWASTRRHCGAMAYSEKVTVDKAYFDALLRR